MMMDDVLIYVFHATVAVLPFAFVAVKDEFVGGVFPSVFLYTSLLSCSRKMPKAILESHSFPRKYQASFFLKSSGLSIDRT